MTGTGGGFLLPYCEPENQAALCAEMNALGLYQMDSHCREGEEIRIAHDDPTIGYDWTALPPIK